MKTPQILTLDTDNRRTGVMNNDKVENYLKVLPLTRIVSVKFATLVKLHLNKYKHD